MVGLPGLRHMRDAVVGAMAAEAAEVNFAAMVDEMIVVGDGC